ncbi:MAG TPA: hypothetical protein DCZ72_04260 [Armatimonadetes bacterium]|nr:hypothetical protein [Armatimonadota bacterium]
MRILALLLALQPVLAATGETTVARWQNDATGAFMLMFDDSWPSHFQVAAPELHKRGLTATFYINPGKGEYKVFEETWRNEVWQLGQVYGVHTMDHKGLADLAAARADLAQCAQLIREMVPGAPDRLISYARPGVPAEAWGISDEEEALALAENNLIDRPPFADHGAVYHFQTLEQMIGLADAAIEAGDLNYLIVHGVERIEPAWNYQDFWALDQDIFVPLLDGLAERVAAGDLWVTDHISAHQYQVERDSARVDLLAADGQEVRLRLSHEADPALYDLPLTLVTEVPAGWARVSVRQGEAEQTVETADGRATYSARAGADEIVLRAAD